MHLEKVTLNDLSQLQQICTNSYSQIFARHWNANGLDLYLEREFGTPRLSSDLNDPKYEYFFIQKDLENIGFIKINHQSSSELSKLDNCELEKKIFYPNIAGWEWVNWQ